LSLLYQIAFGIVFPTTKCDYYASKKPILYSSHAR